MEPRPTIYDVATAAPARDHGCADPSFGRMPGIRPSAIGAGAGSRDLPEPPTLTALFAAGADDARPPRTVMKSARVAFGTAQFEEIRRRASAADAVYRQGSAS